MSDDKIIRVVRVLEYVGPKDRVYKDLENRHIKGEATFSTCGGKGTLKEVSLEEVEFLGESADESEEMHLYRFASFYGNEFEIEGTSPEDAYKNLCNKMNTRTVFRTADVVTLERAFLREGFSLLYPEREYSPVYKQII